MLLPGFGPPERTPGTRGGGRRRDASVVELPFQPFEIFCPQPWEGILLIGGTSNTISFYWFRCHYYLYTVYLHLNGGLPSCIAKYTGTHTQTYIEHHRVMLRAEWRFDVLFKCSPRFLTFIRVFCFLFFHSLPFGQSIFDAFLISSTCFLFILFWRFFRCYCCVKYSNQTIKIAYLFYHFAQPNIISKCSLYGWRFPLPYCSGQMVKEPPPSPLPLPPPVKLGGSPITTPL